MSSKRPSIAVMMTLVLIIALDCATLRYPLSGRPLREILLVLGVLPMANILAVGMLRLRYSRSLDIERRRRLTGFLCSGGGAMIAVVFLSIRSPEPLAGLVAMIAYPVVPLRVPTFLGVAVVGRDLARTSAWNGTDRGSDLRSLRSQCTRRQFCGEGYCEPAGPGLRWFPRLHPHPDAESINIPRAGFASPIRTPRRPARAGPGRRWPRRACGCPR